MDESRRERHLSSERRRIILARIGKEGRVLVCDLVQDLDVSASTARNDLNVLAREGLVHRTHGGAFKIGAVPAEIVQRLKLEAEAKTALAVRAASLVQEGQSIILDAGPVSASIARRVKHIRNLTVITNALAIAFELADAPGVEVIVTGGVLRRHSFCLVGQLTEQALDELAADIMFIGVNAIDPDFGYTTPNLLEAQAIQQMMKVAGEVIAIAEASKFGKRSLALVCRPEEVDKVVTDSSVRRKYVRKLKALGVEVLLVD
jgi:DeoR family transcriptional regulator, aga operon transcriptional repressor